MCICLISIGESICFLVGLYDCVHDVLLQMVIQDIINPFYLGPILLEFVHRMLPGFNEITNDENSQFIDY